MRRTPHQSPVQGIARTTPDDGRLHAPRPPEDAPAGSLPILASIAPVLGSVVLFAITRSPVTLVFAALGPLIAIAGFVDARWTRRRRGRRAAAEYLDAAARLERDIDHAHGLEREALDELHPSGRALNALRGSDPARWRVPTERLTLVSLGRGEVESALQVNDASPEGRWDHARRLSDAPVVIDAADGIGVVGGPTVARAVGRNILLQLARQLPPQAAAFPESIGSPEDAAHWAALAELPHRVGPEPASGSDGSAADLVRVTVMERWRDTRGSTSGPLQRPAAGGILLALSDAVELVPTRCRHLLVIGADGETILADGTGARRSVTLRPGLLADAEADLISLALAEAATTSGESRIASRLPSGVRLEELRTTGQRELPDRGWHSDALRVAVGRSADAPFLLDLAGDGPHAIVGGTTGSGKSELLITWITALAWQNSPAELSFLLVDCKGGASFQAVEALPHVVGMVTDLEPAAAERVVSSLRAELRHREQILAMHGARHLLDPLLAPEHRPARLVVVVDEFQALLDASPHLHQVFADLASRGRSLGLHLILCSQRPAAVAADAILANCTLRLSLRVTSRQDSAAVIGVPDAAALPATAAGRCIVWDGSARTEFQVAVAAPADLLEVRDRWRGSPVPRRPWLDPLPTLLSAATLRSIDREAADAAPGAVPPGLEDGIVFGLADLPERQEQRPAVWSPAQDGSLLVLGAGRTGRTTFLDTVEQAAAGRWRVERLGHDPEHAWDTIVALSDPLRPTPQTLLLVDDVESMLATAGDEHADAIRTALLGLLRDGGRRGLRVVLVASRVGGALHRLAAQTDRTLVLRLADRQEHLVAGASANCFDPRRPPGRAYWDEVEVQIAVPDAAPSDRAAPATAVAWWPEPGTTTILVTRAVRAARSLVQSHSVPGGVQLIEPATQSWTPIGLTDGFRPPEVDRAPSVATVVLVDPESWLSGRLVIGRELPQSAAGAAMVLHGCSAADFRQITRSRELPPLLGYGSARAWWWCPGHEAQRVELFGSAEGRSRGFGSDSGDTDAADDL